MDATSSLAGQGDAASLEATSARRDPATREIQPLRILQLAPALVVGGAERTVALLARELRRAGHTVAVVSMYPSCGSWIEEDLRREGIPLSFLGKHPGLDVRMVPRIARIIRSFRPEVVHTHMYALQYTFPSLAASWRCRAVHTLHSVAEREAHLPGRMLQQLAFRARVVPVAIGGAVAESVRRVYGLTAPAVIPNGIPVVDYAPAPGTRDQVRADLAIPRGAPTFVSVGRLEEVKNTAAVLRAFASPRLDKLRAHLLLAGDGGLRAELERQAVALRIAERVRFLGVRTDIARVLAAADAFVLASRWEGNPLSVMEAMAAGKPVLAAAVGCIPELVPEGCGRLVAPGDEAALEAALFGAAADPVRARVQGEAAARHARERFDVAVMTRAYEVLYRRAR
jgi:glycosyltransferase involved in cell wall biosynthesis